jgi:hypothetical protein
MRFGARVAARLKRSLCRPPRTRSVQLTLPCLRALQTPSVGLAPSGAMQSTRHALTEALSGAPAPAPAGRVQLWGRGSWHRLIPARRDRSALSADDYPRSTVRCSAPVAEFAIQAVPSAGKKLQS